MQAVNDIRFFVQPDAADVVADKAHVIKAKALGRMFGLFNDMAVAINTGKFCSLVPHAEQVIICQKRQIASAACAVNDSDGPFPGQVLDCLFYVNEKTMDLTVFFYSLLVLTALWIGQADYMENFLLFFRIHFKWIHIAPCTFPNLIHFGATKIAPEKKNINQIIRRAQNCRNISRSFPNYPIDRSLFSALLKVQYDVA
jgi:hypothetical protein